MCRRPHKLRALCRSAILLPTAAVLAQLAPTTPTALETSRQTMLQKAFADSQQLTEQYATALAAREAALSAAGHYEEAARFQKRREELTALYSDVPRASTSALPLPLASARLAGSAQVASETLSTLRSSGSGAEWPQFRLTPGSYHLEMEASMLPAPATFSTRFRPQDMAELEFSEVTSLAGTATPTRFPVVIRQSTDETTFTTIRVGPMTFTHATPTLRLVTTASYPANVIRIRNLRLIPQVAANLPAAPAQATAAAVDSTQALEEARLSLITDLAAAQRPVIDAYLASLAKLAATDPTLKSQTDSETQRLEKFIQRGFKSTRFSPPTAIALIARGLDGFEDWSGAQIVADAVTAGDRFTVLHENQKWPIRLLWLSCPPPEPDAAGLKTAASQFGIEEDDALTVGRAAREFTTAYLRDKPLRLLVRPVRDKDGTAAALLFLSDVGLYQNVLIEQGFATLQAPPKALKLGTAEKSLLDALSHRQTVAQKRQPPVGAWALKVEATK